jgi:hypothetical protein
MAKRIVTKIGDIFSVALDNGNQRFFQYIANDLSCLNSSVIRVFKKEYPAEYQLIPDEVVNGDIDFYAHTVLKFGIAEGAWQKVGKCQNVGGTENILFRMYLKNAVDHADRIWYAWYINKERFTIGKLSEEYREKSDIGLVLPYTDIVSRIKVGVMPGTMFLPNEH